MNDIRTPNGWYEMFKTFAITCKPFGFSKMLGIICYKDLIPFGGLKLSRRDIMFIEKY